MENVIVIHIDGWFIIRGNDYFDKYYCDSVSTGVKQSIKIFITLRISINTMFTTL